MLWGGDDGCGIRQDGICRQDGMRRQDGAAARDAGAGPAPAAPGHPLRVRAYGPRRVRRRLPVVAGLRVRAYGPRRAGCRLSARVEAEPLADHDARLHRAAAQRASRRKPI
ncbi:hypothetical protein SSP531S_02900 [Streptomyces spongiicola]|uniref:Uncharacterized protein n=1 Tax=Streptomyces spongiicola TaxID=1690221 RepID=A0A388SQH9_9ACTN|nr:hypothetical protein SSP531S_02900 [Streptomyces spongiicola]